MACELAERVAQEFNKIRGEEMGVFKILGKATLLNSVLTTLYTVPAGKMANVTINICNTGRKNVLLRLALSASGTPMLDEYIEYDRTIDTSANWEPIERTGIKIGAGTKVVAYGNNDGINVMVWGEERACPVS